MSDFYSQSEQIAGKPHRCDFCSTAIEKGERYSRSAGVFEGDFFVWKEHLDCRAAGLELMELSGEYSYHPLSDLEDEDRVWIKQDYPTIFARMADHD